MLVKNAFKLWLCDAVLKSDLDKTLQITKKSTEEK